MKTQTFLRTLVWETCFKCGVGFGLDAEHKRDLLRDKTTFYCPNGHGQYYPAKTKEQQRIEQLERDVQSRDRLLAEYVEDDEALTYDLRDAQQRAKKYRDRPAQKGAFWRGYTDRECGRETGCCPYPTNRFGFRRAWFDGFGADYFAADTTEGE